MYLFICWTHWSLFPMVLLQNTCTIEIKEWVPSYELVRTIFVKNKNQSHTRYREVCGNISSPMPVSFFQCLLLWSTFHMRTNIMDMARERIGLILELMAMFLLFQMIFSLVTAAVVWAILDSTSGLVPPPDTIAPRYLELRTVSSFVLSMVKSVLMPFVLFVINWVFSALICMPSAVEAASRWFSNLTSSCSCPARPSMSSAKCKFVIFLPLTLTVPSWFSSASAILLSMKMLKRVGESRHPWRTPVVVRNHSPMLLSW